MKSSIANQQQRLQRAVMLCVILSLVPSGVWAATRSPTVLSGGTSSRTTGFESRLWEQLYRGNSDEQESQDDEAMPNLLEQGTDSPTAAQDRLRSVNAYQITTQVVAFDDPEDTTAPELCAPGVISDWNIAKLSAAHGNDYTLRSNGGPTATTILVGLVAAIVLMGAMFSGKE